MKRILPLLILTSLPIGAETRDTPDILDPPITPNFTLRLTAGVIAEDGNPIENSDVHVGIVNINDFKDGRNDIRGKTDIDGKFSAEGIGLPEATISAMHEGYYPSTKTYSNWGSFQEAKTTGKYAPWDPLIELSLKKIGKPIPMLVWLDGDDSIKTSPNPGKAVGFDLFEGDWVAPHGKGKTSDLLITLTLLEKNDVDGAVKGGIRFANKEDGLIPIMELSAPESVLKYPRIALEDGYDVKFVSPPYAMPVSGVEVEAPEPVGYFFRIRTQKDESTGKILSAFYGKIISQPGIPHPSQSPFQLHRYSYSNQGRKIEPGVRFSYYLNPTANDRNLEYDQRTNLAPEADEGSVYAP